jgi:hypothetical protein
LSDELKKIAEDELRETDEVRTHAIKAMRDWILNNPRIEKCRMDSKFLLRFLRFRKYSIPMAQEALERYLVFREGVYGLDWFSDLDFTRPGVQTLFNNGFITILPNRDESGRKTFLVRLGAIDPKISSAGNDVLLLSTLVMETLLDDEGNQIRGLNYVGDVTGVQLNHTTIFPIELMYKLGKNVEKTCAARHKAFHVVNVNPTFKFLVNFGLKHMPEKLQNRVKFYSTFDEIDAISKQNLPSEYGGTMNIKEMIGNQIITS